MKIIVIPDSYKGTLSSSQICDISAKIISRIFCDAEVICVPVADGGEGSVDCFLSALGGKKIYLNCSGPYLENMRGFYGMLPDKSTAVIEMAAAAGLPLVENRKNPLLTTTFGVGEIILAAAKNGAKKIILGLGGSCTNDFGCGAATACGIRFYDADGKQFIPTGGTLKDIKHIDISSLSPLLSGVEIITMCDIDNPPYGKNGAAEIFAPQKGADIESVRILDAGVKHLCGVINDELGINIHSLSGGGAAGAMGAGMAAFFHSTLQMGIDTVLNTVQFDKMLSGADFVITGEGKIDSQSLRGKVVIGVARAAKAKAVPVIAVVGGAEGDLSEAYDEGVTSIFTVNRMPQDFSISKHQAKENYEFAFENILRLLKSTL